MTVTARDLEDLEKKVNQMRDKSSKIKGGIEAVFKQLKKLGVDSIESAQEYLKKKNEEKKKHQKELEKIVQEIEELIG